ncbi:hypothetical protein LOK49_LG12G00932 [Camellia lanceoleosa]|uniref:Uncharacterized protein n=1 Tax=Camellia lanceoleosa TaxID=1840588 RepID=A0ACC0FU84_9ERIC|nr:hypothetical protein LOK49_LG12G00932 [Camellia lanceoleosa]
MATVANNSQVQPSSHSYNIDSSKLASSSATSSPSASLLYTKEFELIDKELSTLEELILVESIVPHQTSCALGKMRINY